MTPDLDPKWFTVHDNLVLLVHYLVEQGESAAVVAYAVEKPWYFEDEFEAALEQVEGDVP
jgi:hypothetical protein